MHDPMVVAFEIRRPWPQRSRAHDAQPGGHRWRIRYRHDCAKYGCETEHAGQRFFPWWRPGSYSSSWVLAGRGWYWPTLITIWHVEPDGRDSGEVCRHYVRVKRPDGTYKTRVTKGWRWHVFHIRWHVCQISLGRGGFAFRYPTLFRGWRIQVRPLQQLRRTLLTRCEWCGGPSRKGDRVNVSHRWDGERGPWWRGERGLYHVDCSLYEHAHRSCRCDEPLVERGGSFGKCVLCGKPAAGRLTPSMLERRRLLASVPEGTRNPDVVAQVKALAAADRERHEQPC